MSYALKYSRSAETEIEQQVLWYEADEIRGGSDLASRWLDGLLEDALKIALNPSRHPFAPENGRWMPHHVIRQSVYRPWKGKAGWRVLYVINERKKVVTILQVRHERRRWLHEPE